MRGLLRGQPPSSADWTRVGVVAIVLAVAVAGLRSRGAFAHAADETALAASGAALASIVAIAEGVAIIAFAFTLVLGRPDGRMPDEDEDEEDTDDELVQLRIPWWVKFSAMVAALVALAAPFFVLYVKRTPAHHAVVAARAHPDVALSGHPRAAATGGSAWFVVGGMVAAITVAIVVTAIARRRRAQTSPPRAPAGAVTPLATGLNAGSEALLAGGDPRRAIIACYAAMERGFAAAGSAPAPADSPAEVLDRAIAAGVIRSGAPGVLTGLFRLARYSAKPMTSADSEAAATALSQMRDDLDGGTGLADDIDLIDEVDEVDEVDDVTGGR